MFRVEVERGASPARNNKGSGRMGQGFANRGERQARGRNARRGRKSWAGVLERGGAGWLGALSLVAVPACARVDVDEQHGRESVQHAVQAVASSRAVVVRRVGEDYEIEVRGDRALTPRGDGDPALRIGEVTLEKYSNAPDSAKVAIFPVSAEQFYALPDGAEVAVVYDKNGPGLVYGVLDKSAVEVAP
jgi:hypothetical protein